MKQFGDRLTDFGESYISTEELTSLSPDTRWIAIQVGDEVWRVELEPDEVADDWLVSELEQQAKDFLDIARIALETRKRPRG